MRVLVLFLVLLAGCRAPYTTDLADLTVWPDGLPPAGTASKDLANWFEIEGYASGPDVHQSRAALMRRPGDPLLYTLASQKQWWKTQSRSVRDFCITTRTVYYRLDDKDVLEEAVQTHRSIC